MTHLIAGTRVVRAFPTVPAKLGLAWTFYFLQCRVIPLQDVVTAAGGTTSKVSAILNESFCEEHLVSLMKLCLLIDNCEDGLAKERRLAAGMHTLEEGVPSSQVELNVVTTAVGTK